jgi:hypothetical protein
MTWNRRHHPKRDAARELLAVGGLLPMALLAGGYATDEDDDVPDHEVDTPAA